MHHPFGKNHLMNVKNKKLHFLSLYFSYHIYDVFIEYCKDIERVFFFKGNYNMNVGIRMEWFYKNVALAAS